MTIEFSCPYCTVRIRVPDEAANKKGSCPKCHTQLIVPSVPQTQPQPPQGTHPGPSSNPLPQPTPEPPAQTALPADFVSAPTTQSVRGRKRRRRRNNNRLVLIWLACAAAFVGVVLLVVFLQDTQEQAIAGTITARVISDKPLGPALITANDVDMTPDEFQQVRNRLIREPLLLSSELAQTEFRGTDSGVEMYVRPSSKAKLVEVDLRSNNLLLGYLTEQADSLNRRRLTALARAATEFVRELAQPDPDRNYLGRPSYFRNELALNALRREFGFAVEAVAARQICACVAEKSGDTAWFIVPRGATSIELRGRKTDSAGVLFDGSLTGQIIEAEIVSTETMEEPESPDTDDSKSEDSSTDEPTDGMESGETTDDSMNDEGMQESMMNEKTD